MLRRLSVSIATVLTLMVTVTVMAVVAVVPEATAGTQTAATKKATTLTVGLIPIVDTAPLFLGLRKGFFKKHGLNIKIEAAQSGPALVAAVQSGSVDVGFAAPHVLMLAETRGLTFKFLAPFSVIPNTRSQATLLVRKDSSIRSFRDLSDKKIAFLGFGTVMDLVYHVVTEQFGISYSSLKLIPTPYPNQAQLIEAGDVDAAILPEPFQTFAMATGKFRVVSPNNPMSLLGLKGTRVPSNVWFSDPKFVTEHPDVARAFRKAMAESTRYAARHDRELRSILPKFMNVPKDVVQKVVFPEYVTEFKFAWLQMQAELLQKYGIAPKLPNVRALLWNPGGSTG